MKNSTSGLLGWSASIFLQLSTLRGVEITEASGGTVTVSDDPSKWDV